MKILVDADSCPKKTRRVIMRAATKREIPAVFAANRPIPKLFGTGTMELCSCEIGAADDRIVELASTEDIVVTRDVGLAKRLVSKSVAVLDDRGRVFTKENIGEHLSIRCFQIGLVERGADIERIANYGKKELKSFADSFDKMLTRLGR